MRLTEHLTALRAWCKQCLPGWRKFDELRPGIVGMRGSMVVGLRPCANPVHPLPSPPPQKHTRGCIFRIFFDRHFITGGTLNTTPPSDVRLKTYRTPKKYHTRLGPIL